MTIQINYVDVASYTVAGLMAASKLLSVTQAFWSKLPVWAAVALPVVALDIPQLIAYFTNVSGGAGLATALVTSAALLLPGIEQAEAAAK